MKSGSAKRVRADPTRVKQIVFNLLSNALKFTFKGSITLQCDSLTADSYRISVTDTGIGINAKQLAHIFEPFNKGTSKNRRSFNKTGCGLGLRNCQVIAQGLKPDSVLAENVIQVTSKEGEGSCFSFVVCDKSNQQPPESSSSDSESDVSINCGADADADADADAENAACKHEFEDIQEPESSQVVDLTLNVKLAQWLAPIAAGRRTNLLSLIRSCPQSN